MKRDELGVFLEGEYDVFGDDIWNFGGDGEVGGGVFVVVEEDEGLVVVKVDLDDGFVVEEVVVVVV